MGTKDRSPDALGPAAGREEPSVADASLCSQDTARQRLFVIVQYGVQFVPDAPLHYSPQ